MVERHALTRRQRRRIETFEVATLPKLLQRKNFEATLVELDETFGEVLAGLMTTRPKSSIGIWQEPTADQIVRSRRLILARLLMFATHNQAKAGNAATAKNELTQLDEWIDATPQCLGNLNQSTEAYIESQNSSALLHLSALATAIDDLVPVVADLALNYPTKKLQGVSCKADAAIDFVVLVYLHTTGAYPSLSSETEWPSTELECADLSLIAPLPSFTADWGQGRLAPLPRLARYAVEVIERARRARRMPAKTRRAKKERAREKLRHRKISQYAFERRCAALRKKTQIRD